MVSLIAAAAHSLRIAPAHAALTRAQEAAELARVPALLAEVAEARAALDRPAARRLLPGGEHALRLGEVAALLDSGALVVDACRMGLSAAPRRSRAMEGSETDHTVRAELVEAGSPSTSPGRTENAAWLPLARRPILFALARALAEAWPGDVDREAPIANVFRTRHPDETHRARLRVEIGRLRALVKPMAAIAATAQGFMLQPHDGRNVVVIAPPIDGDEASLLALLSDGAAWSPSALALALGDSQRTVQRALSELEAAGRVRAIGQARSRRWLSPPLAGFTTIL